MDIQVLEGRFVEVPTAAVTGMERRAFGEFVSHRGELASYAFGWTTGSEPHAAAMSIGIGAGNPGGGTFHAVVFSNEGGHAFSLTDEPVLLVAHDADDGLWQLIGTTDGRGSNAKIGHLHHAIDEDQTLIDVLDLAPGQSATRSRIGGPWTRHTD